MIHSARARPIVTPVANIVLCCFVFLDLKSGYGRTDGRNDGHVRKQWSLPARDFGLAEWINIIIILSCLHFMLPMNKRQIKLIPIYLVLKLTNQKYLTLRHQICNQNALLTCKNMPPLEFEVFLHNVQESTTIGFGTTRIWNIMNSTKQTVMIM